MCSWMIREDVAEAVVDAVALVNEPAPDYEKDPFNFLGWSDPVILPPWS